MAKKKMSLQVDWKQLGLQYGDKVGLGVAGLLALLLIVVGLTSSETVLSAQEIAKNKTDTQNAVQRHPVDADKLEPSKLEPDRVKSVEQIAALSENLKQPLPVGVLATVFPWGDVVPLDDTLRSNPDVLAAVALAAKPVHISFRAYDIREVGGNVEVLVARPEKPIEIKEDAKEKEERRKRNQGGGGGRGGGGPKGGGGDMGVGGGKPGLTDPNKSAADSSGNRWTGRYIPIKEEKDDIWAHQLVPARAAYVWALYPHAKQLEINSRALKVDKSVVPSYYQPPEIQRRELILKGTRLEDGTVAPEDLVIIEDGQGGRVRKPLREVPNVDKDAEAGKAGWAFVDRTVLSDALRRVPTSEFFVEPDEIVTLLLANSQRLAMRIPKPVHGELPSMINDLPQLKALVEKIKKDRTVIPPPRKDPRLDRGTDNAFGDEPFSSAPPPAGGMQSGAADPDKKEGGSSDFIPEFGIIRFLDLELPEQVGGRTFEYRVRVVLTNPNFDRPDEVAVRESANVKELRGAWSPTVRVTFPQDSYVFADERIRKRAGDATDFADLDKVPLQVHLWLGRITTEGGSGAEERVGNWWIDRILASRGEFIGRVPSAYAEKSNRPKGSLETFEQRSGETSMIVWVPTTPTEPGNVSRMGIETLTKVRSHDLVTRFLLVDFEGGARVAFRPVVGTGFVREEVPAEILVLEPNGRMFARNVLADRDIEERKVRFTKWNQWFETVKEKANRATKPKEEPKGGPKPQGG